MKESCDQHDPHRLRGSAVLDPQERHKGGMIRSSAARHNRQPITLAFIPTPLLALCYEL
jgi:hypothetical protein